MIRNRQILRPVGIALLIFILSVIFIEPLRSKMNNLFMFRDRGELKEEEVIGTILGYNPRVKEVQEVLKNAGFYAGRADGFMGAKTREAVMNFQSKKGLQVTGRINQLTLLAINRQGEIPKEDSAASRAQAPVASKQEPLVLKQQKVPETIKPLPLKTEQIQNALAKAGFYKGKIDGIMGPKTRRAIKAFQKSRGLKADGVIGLKTQSALSEYLN